jgi:hypothetical protein
MRAAKDYAETLGLKLAYATNGHGIVEFDYSTGLERELDVFPVLAELWARLAGDQKITDERAGRLLASFLQMALEYGGVETARRHLWKDDVSDRFTTLWELKRLDLSVEAYVLRPENAPLFTAEERGIERARLLRGARLSGLSNRFCFCDGGAQ